jgi:hypothetical protein
LAPGLGRIAFVGEAGNLAPYTSLFSESVCYLALKIGSGALCVAGKRER